jgi:hypothetical protein
MTEHPSQQIPPHVQLIQMGRAQIITRILTLRPDSNWQITLRQDLRAHPSLPVPCASTRIPCIG